MREVRYTKVKAFPHYEVGVDGSVLSYKNNRHGTTETPRKLKPTKNAHGYLSVDLKHNGRRRMAMVHRLVAENFAIKGKGGCVNHIDGNQLNNNAANLEWCTNQENLRHHFRTLKRNVGDTHWNTKISSAQYRKILSLRKSGWSQREIAEKYGVHPSTISYMLKRGR